MINLGMKQTLVVKREKEFGIYLGEDGVEDMGVLLPKKQVPEGTKVGDELEVFVYNDSNDRLIATVNEPKLQVGEMAVLEVKEVTKIGAFLDMGLEKDVLLPYKEQMVPVRKGDQCLVALYVDKTKRLAVTTKVYDRLRSDAPYEKDDKVVGTVCEIHETIGAFVAIDNMYYGLIPKQQIFTKLRIGERVEGRVIKVREDGKIDISIREKAHVQMDQDAEAILKVIEEFDGVLPFNDKVNPEVIKREFNLSKNAFKRAVGRLLKEGKIEITEKSIKKL